MYGIVENSFPEEESPWNKHFSENGLPQRTKFLSHQVVTNCDVSRVFGSKSGCGVVACGMVLTFVQMHHLQVVSVIGHGQPQWTKICFTLDFLIL